MNSCFVSFDYILMFFSLFSDSAAFFCFICICFGGPIRCLKIAGVSQLGLFWYLMSISRWFGEVSVYCPTGPTTNEAARCEGRQVQPLRQRPLLLELTNICFEIFSTFFRSFRSLISPENIHRSLHFSVFSLVRC